MKATHRTAWRKVFLAVWLAAVVLVLVPALSEAQGKPFTVNSTADAVDAKPGDGLCRTAAGVCTLRAAIQEANGQPARSVITIPPGTYVLTIPGADEEASATGDLDITKSLTILGAGPSSTIVDGNGPNGPNGITDRVFHVLSSAGVVNISGLTVRNGSVFGDGAGILNQGAILSLTNVVVAGNGNLNGDGGGGGIENVGTLKLSNSVVTGNAAFFDGPGILNGGKMELLNVTVSNNGTSEGDGGGISNFGSAKLTNVTVSGNRGFSVGGGIRTDGSMTLTNVTISGNFATGCSGIYGSASTSLTNVTIAQNVAVFLGICVGGPVTNTIIANNLDFNGNSANCSEAGSVGTVNSAGYNLSSDGTCGLTGPGDLNNIDPMLGPLANNGGFTLTHALLPNSPAIDAGTNLGCPSTDQRGIHRPLPGIAGDRAICDIGAYEFKRP